MNLCNVDKLPAYNSLSICCRNFANEVLRELFAKSREYTFHRNAQDVAIHNKGPQIAAGIPADCYDPHLTKNAEPMIAAQENDECLLRKLNAGPNGGINERHMLDKLKTIIAIRAVDEG